MSLAEPDPRPRALVVDDDAFVLRALGQLLQSENYEVELADSALAALDRLDVDLDVVVLDWQLGADTAERVVRRMRERRLPAGLLIISGEAGPRPADTLTAYGGVAFLRKPVRAEQVCFYAALATTLARARRDTAGDEIMLGVEMGLPLRVDADGNPLDWGDSLYEFLGDRLQRIGELTERQRQVAIGCLRGSSHEDMAKELGIASSTVRTHMSLVYQRTGAENRADLLRVIAADLAREQREREGNQ